MKSDSIKRMSITEFRELGYLQELNRRFLHPLGLALEVSIDENGNESLSSIWDYRHEKEGIYYDLKNSDDERKEVFKKKYDFIEKEMHKRFSDRMDKLGFFTEPVK